MPALMEGQMADQENEVVISTGKKIAVGSDWWELVDDTTAVEYVDFITEARQFNGVIHLALGAGVVDAENMGVVHVTQRLRMSLTTAQILHNLLGGMISDALKPIDKSQAN